MSVVFLTALPAALFLENQSQKIALKNSSLQGLVPGMMTYKIDSVQVPDGLINNMEYPILDDYFDARRVDTTDYNGRTALLIGNPNAAFGDSIPMEYNDVVCTPCYPYIWDEEITDWKNAVPLDIDENWYYSNYNFLLNDSLVKSDIPLFDFAYYISYAEGLGIVTFISDTGLSGSAIFMIGYHKGDEEYGTVYSSSEDIIR